MTLLIDERTLQNFLKTNGYYKGPLDGIVGPQTNAAIKDMLLAKGVAASNWGVKRQHVAISQLFFKEQGIEVGAIDGLIGPQTRYANEEWIRRSRDLVLPKQLVAHQPTIWPRQKDLEKFFGAKGTNQVMLDLPYPMRIAWDKKNTVTQISVHKKVAEPMYRVLENVKKTYKNDLSKLGLDLFGGCLNVRKMRGGNSWSTHSWGIAIDIDPDHNQLSWGKNKARFGKPEYKEFIDAWYVEGAISLGREANYDWMHFQFARL